jgi:hypothetical protein
MMFEDDLVLDSNLLEEYNDFFIEVTKWGAFESSDIELSNVWEATSVPDFVAEFEGKLDNKPGLAPDVRCFLDLSVCFPI